MGSALRDDVAHPAPATSVVAVGWQTFMIKILAEPPAYMK